MNDSARSDYPGKALLHGQSAREILRRLIDGDPLELFARCQDEMAEAALLLSLKRLHLRAVARVAHAAPRYRGEPPLDEWLRDRIQVSMRELLEEDREDDRREVFLDATCEERYTFLSAVLGQDARLARRACVRFNALPHSARRAFFAIVVVQVPFNRYVAQGNGTPAQIKASLRRAMEALGLEGDSGVPRSGQGGSNDG